MVRLGVGGNDRGHAVPAQTLKNPGFEIPGRTLVSASDAPGGKADIRGQIAEGWADNSSWADVKLDYSLDSASPHSRQARAKGGNNARL